MRIPLACCLLCCVLAVDLFIYFSSLPSLFSISIWTSFVSSGLTFVSVSVSAATRFAYDMYRDTYNTYADLTFSFFV